MIDKNSKIRTFENSNALSKFKILLYLHNILSTESVYEPLSNAGLVEVK